MPMRLSQPRFEEEIKDQARHHQAGEQTQRHADGQRHAEAFDRAGAEVNKNNGRNERGGVRIKNDA